MTIYIIGAGPGAPDLITERGAKLIENCPVVLYTGSLVPKAMIERAREDALVLDSAGMTLEEIVKVMHDADERGEDVARVHTGDPSIFGSTAEQMRKLQALGIDYEIVPGVSSFVAAAAALGKELTLPELSQTVIVSRVEGRTPMPEGESLTELAQHGATLCLFLSATLLKKIVKELAPIYGADYPIAVVQKASMPEQKIAQGTLGDIVAKVQAEKITSQAMIIIGEVLTSEDFADSRLYAEDFSHKFRRAKKTKSE